MELKDILSKIEWKDESATGAEIGNIKTAFPDAQTLLVKNSKADRATIMLKQGSKVTNLTIGLELTKLVRAGLVTMEHLVLMPLLYNEKQNQIYVGRPSEGWLDVKEISGKDFIMPELSFDDITA